ncbi:hypothetical protein HAX54_017125 [Datura stramonium]|uniref:PB1-like domain-containing protein n=1 Tax=Datura stramonium TaxID=4076 RepID=A0ABS8S0D7_DATST|nr:hypothetical protein [Datura stramonium]
MNEEAHLIFNYGGIWVREPQLVYIKKLIHVWKEYDVDLLSYIDICREYKEKLEFTEVKQLLVVGPSGRFYALEGDEGIRTLQYLLCGEFKVLNLFAVDEGEENVVAPSIIHYCETFTGIVDAQDEGKKNIVAPSIIDDSEIFSGTVEAGTDCDSNEEEDNECASSDYNEGLEVFRRERTKEINEKLDMYKELEKGMTFKDILEARKVIGLYSIAIGNEQDHVEHEDEARNLKEDFSPLAREAVAAKSPGIRKIGLMGNGSGVLCLLIYPIHQERLLERKGCNDIKAADLHWSFEVNDYSGVGLTSILPLSRQLLH